MRPKEQHCQQHNWSENRQGFPLGTGKAAHHPVGNGLHALFIIGKVNDKAGERTADCAQRHACQKQLYRIAATTQVRDKQYAQRHSKGTDKGCNADKVFTKRNADAKQNCCRRTQRSTGGNTQNIRVSQGVLYYSLHNNTADRKAHAD